MKSHFTATPTEDTQDFNNDEKLILQDITIKETLSDLIEEIKQKGRDIESLNKGLDTDHLIDKKKENIYLLILELGKLTKDRDYLKFFKTHPELNKCLNSREKTSILQQLYANYQKSKEEEITDVLPELKALQISNSDQILKKIYELKAYQDHISELQTSEAIENYDSLDKFQEISQYCFNVIESTDNFYYEIIECSKENESLPHKKSSITNEELERGQKLLDRLFKRLSESLTTLDNLKLLIDMSDYVIHGSDFSKEDITMELKDIVSQDILSEDSLSEDSLSEDSLSEDSLSEYSLSEYSVINEFKDEDLSLIRNLESDTSYISRTLSAYLSGLKYVISETHESLDDSLYILTQTRFGLLYSLPFEIKPFLDLGFKKYKEITEFFCIPDYDYKLGGRLTEAYNNYDDIEILIEKHNLLRHRYCLNEEDMKLFLIDIKDYLKLDTPVEELSEDPNLFKTLITSFRESKEKNLGPVRKRNNSFTGELKLETGAANSCATKSSNGR